MAKPKPVVKEGKVVSANKKFYVVIGRTRRVIPTGALVDAAALKKLAGKPVPVTVLEKSIVAIGPRPEVESRVRHGILPFWRGVPKSGFLTTLTRACTCLSPDLV